MNICGKLFIILNFSVLIRFAVSDDNLGPADLTIIRIEECENPDNYQIKMPIEMSKINRTHAGFTGCIDIDGEFDESIAINLTAAKWGDGGWKPNALNFYQTNACKVISEGAQGPWDTILNGTGRENAICPLPKGEYCVEKLAMDLEGVFPSMLYGKFRIDIEFLKVDTAVLCLRAFVKSDPAKSG